MESSVHYEQKAWSALTRHDELPTDDLARPELMARAQVYATLAQAAATEELQFSLGRLGGLVG